MPSELLLSAAPTEGPRHVAPGPVGRHRGHPERAGEREARPVALTQAHGPRRRDHGACVYRQRLGEGDATEAYKPLEDHPTPTLPAAVEEPAGTDPGDRP